MSMSFEQIESVMTSRGQALEVETIDIAGNSVRNWKNAPQNMVEVLRNSAVHGDADYIVFGEERLSFREHYAQAAALANHLVSAHP